jgi:hypothetical protein
MALWPITPHSRCLIDVTTPRRQHPRPGIRFHRSSLPPDEVTTSAEIPVTTVPRTLVDLAADMRPRQLEPALGEAEARAAGTTTTRSELEVRFLEFIDQAGLPQPETNAIIAGFEVDCVWRDRRIIVELDGCAFHSTFEAFDRDRERDRILPDRRLAAGEDHSEAFGAHTRANGIRPTQPARSAERNSADRAERQPVRRSGFSRLAG